ncbi:hypothetical protein ELH38_38220 [Rhizobium ruizarguesonis]|nr:hypothetical protein ELH38_38220 [Rhizobium ruizarguesonis]
MYFSEMCGSPRWCRHMSDGTAINAIRDVSSLLTEVAAHHSALLRARSLYRERLAPDFNPLDFMRIDELNLSRIFAWLVRPDGSHGQGAAFLQLLAELTGSDWSPTECSAAQVYLEHGTGDGRIDILVKSGKRALAIENKPFADDQPDQLERYLQYLDGLGLPDYRLLYLTPNGTVPGEKSIRSQALEARVDSAHLCLVSYNVMMLEWLTACRSVCRADRVSVFIDEIARAVRKVFQGVSDMSDQEHMTDVMAATPQSVAAAMIIANTNLSLKLSLIARLEQQLGRLIDAKGWKLARGFSPTKHSEIQIDFDEQSPVVVSFMFDRSNFNELAIGIVKRQGVRFEGNPLHYAMRNLLGAGHGAAGEEWPWWRSLSLDNDICPLPKDWETNVEVWAKIADGSATPIMMSAIETVADACLKSLADISRGAPSV